MQYHMHCTWHTIHIMNLKEWNQWHTNGPWIYITRDLRAIPMGRMATFGTWTHRDTWSGLVNQIEEGSMKNMAKILERRKWIWTSVRIKCWWLLDEIRSDRCRRDGMSVVVFLCIFTIWTGDIPTRRWPSWLLAETRRPLWNSLGFWPEAQRTFLNRPYALHMRVTSP